MTPDGRFIAFVANVTGTAGTNTAIYLWDAQTGTNVLVSANTNNLLPAANSCDAPAISSNGQYVAFFSDSAELATNASGGGPFLYLRNMTAGTTSLVNADTNGVSFGDISMQNIALSQDGQFVAFESIQPSLVANDCNRDFDVFLRNVGTGTTELISTRHPSLPSLTADGQSTFSAQPLSQDGHYLAFASAADDLVAGATNRSGDVFVCDLYAGTNALVSVGINGTGGSANSYEPAISGNGRYVAFTSAATNLIAGDNNQSTDVFVRDLLAQTTSLVSVDSTGTGEGNGNSYSPVISSDGRFVLFVSLANNLAAVTQNGYDNLFLRDRQTGVTYALTTTGQTCASMTPDGHFIAFVAFAVNGSSSIYLWDAQLAHRVATNTMTPGGIQAISISPDGNRIACFSFSSPVSLSTWDRAANRVYTLGTGYLGSHFRLRFSADSRYLTYALSATANGTNQIYLYDFLAQNNVLVSHGAGVSAPANGSSDSADISADGRFVAYRSAADNIVPGDANGVPDVFLFDATTGTNTILSSGSPGHVAADNRSLAPVFSGDGHTLVFRSWGTDLVAGDFNQSQDLFAFAFLYAAVTADNGGNIILNWPAAPDQTFGVQYKNDLTDPAWNTAAGSVTIIGHRGYLTDTALTPGHRFYRIVTGN